MEPPSQDTPWGCSTPSAQQSARQRSIQGPEGHCQPIHPIKRWTCRPYSSIPATRRLSRTKGDLTNTRINHSDRLPPLLALLNNLFLRLLRSPLNHQHLDSPVDIQSKHSDKSFHLQPLVMATRPSPPLRLLHQSIWEFDSNRRDSSILEGIILPTPAPCPIR